MKSIKLFFILAVTTLMIQSCSQEDRLKLEGSGNLVTESRDANSFNSVNVSSALDGVTINYGTEESITVTADDNIMSQVITEVSGNSLKVDLKDGNYRDFTVEVVIVTSSFEQLSLNGTTDVEINGFEDLDFFEIDTRGTGNITMNGSADKLVIDQSGTGNIEAFDFPVENCEVMMSGTGNSELKVAEMLEGNLTGTGDLLYKGSTSLDIKDTGVGQVINAN